MIVRPEIFAEDSGGQYGSLGVGSFLVLLLFGWVVLMSLLVLLYIYYNVDGKYRFALYASPLITGLVVAGWWLSTLVRF